MKPAWLRIAALLLVISSAAPAWAGDGARCVGRGTIVECQVDGIRAEFRRRPRATNAPSEGAWMEVRLSEGVRAVQFPIWVWFVGAEITPDVVANLGTTIKVSPTWIRVADRYGGSGAWRTEIDQLVRRSDFKRLGGVLHDDIYVRRAAGADLAAVTGEFFLDVDDSGEDNRFTAHFAAPAALVVLRVQGDALAVDRAATRLVNQRLVDRAAASLRNGVQDERRLARYTAGYFARYLDDAARLQNVLQLAEKDGDPTLAVELEKIVPFRNPALATRRPDL